MAGEHELSDDLINELRARWESEDGHDVLHRMLKDLRAGGESWLSDVKQLANEAAALNSETFVADLRGINFDGQDLTGLDLCFVDLRYSSFHECTLIETCFQRSDLSHCDFSGSAMQKADLLQVRAQRANFLNCDLSGSMMMASDFRNSSFRSANLRNSVLDNSNLAGCELAKADLERAHMLGTIKPDDQAPYARP